jgi:hypothetical protein
MKEIKFFLIFLEILFFRDFVYSHMPRKERKGTGKHMTPLEILEF